MSATRLTGRRCQCAACGQYFSRLRAFDRHRIGSYGKPGLWGGPRRCLTPEEMRQRGWQRNEAGCWTMQRLDRAGQGRIRPDQLPTPIKLPGSARMPLVATTPAASNGLRERGAHEAP